MLELLDLRERGERLEAIRPEIDPTVFETVQRILQRVFVEGDEVLVELAQRFDDADLSDTGLLVRREEFAVAEHETPDDLKRALDALIERMRDLHARQLPTEWWDERDGVRYGEIVRPDPGRRVLRPGRTRRLPLLGLHDRRPRRGRRRAGDRALHPASRRRHDPSGGPVRREASRERPTSRKPVARKRSPRWPTGPNRSRRSTGSSDPATRT